MYKNEFKRESITLNIMAVIHPFTENCSSKWLANIIIAPFITSINKPRVSIVMGRDIIFKMGF